MHRAETISPLGLRVELAGVLPSDVYGYARDKVAMAVSHAHEPVLAVRVRVTRCPDPAVKRPVIAQANLDVNGHLVRAQVAAATVREAVDLLEARLRARLDRSALHWEARRGRASIPEPRHWRHRVELGQRPEYVPRPAEDCEIIRRKAFTLARCTIDWAAAEMDDLDYDFHLFTETGAGQDSVLYHGGPAGYRLAQVDPDRHHLTQYTVPLTVSDIPAPRLSAAQAVDRLTYAGLGFVFFVDVDTDRSRGCVLYRRYDGHYGLITPAADEPGGAS